MVCQLSCFCIAAAWIDDPQLAASRSLQRPAAGQRAITTKRCRLKELVLARQFGRLDLQIELPPIALHHDR
ncbi:MAG: hypothetical protein ACKOHJ_07365, partial [Vulcanococcus sp.]